MSDLIDQFLERQKKKAESDSYDLSENTYDSYLTSCRVLENSCKNTTLRVLLRLIKEI